MPSITDSRILWYIIWINDPLFSRLQFWRMIWLDLYLRVTGTQDIHSLRRHASHQRWLLAGVQSENYKLKLKCSNKRLACIHLLTVFQYCAHYYLKCMPGDIQWNIISVRPVISISNNQKTLCIYLHRNQSCALIDHYETRRAQLFNCQSLPCFITIGCLIAFYDN